MDDDDESLASSRTSTSTMSSDYKSPQQSSENLTPRPLHPHPYPPRTTSIAPTTHTTATTTSHYRSISPISASRAATDSIERSNNHRAMLSHRDSLLLRTRYDHATNPPLRAPNNTDLLEKLAKLKRVLRRALDKRAHKLGHSGGRTNVRSHAAAATTPSSAGGREVRRVPVGAHHYSQYPAGPKPHQQTTPIPTPIYEAHRSRRPAHAPGGEEEFYRAFAIVKANVNETETSTSAAQPHHHHHHHHPPAYPASPTPIPRKPLPYTHIPPQNIQTVPHHRVQPSGYHHHHHSPSPSRERERERESEHARISTGTDRISSTTEPGQLIPPEALQASVKAARAQTARFRAGEGRLTRISDFIHAYSPTRPVGRRPVTVVRRESVPQEQQQQQQQQGGWQQKEKKAVAQARCSLCGLALPSTRDDTAAPLTPRAEGWEEKGLRLCQGCRHNSNDGVAMEVAPAKVPAKVPTKTKTNEQRALRRRSRHESLASRNETESGAVDEREQQAWHCEHCFVGFGSRVPVKGGLCICPICGREIKEGGLGKGKGRAEQSRFSDVSEWTDGDGEEKEGGDGLGLRVDGGSPVSPVGEGRSDGHGRELEGRRVSMESRQTEEARESHIPGIDATHSRQSGPNLHLAYDFPPTPPSMTSTSSAATTAIDLSLPPTPPVPARSSSKNAHLKAKTAHPHPRKLKYVASSIYPTDEGEKEYYTSNKPLPARPRDSMIATQHRVRGSPELEPAEIEAIASMPPLDETYRDSGIWPVHRLRQTMPVDRRSSFYGFYKPILDS